MRPGIFVHDQRPQKLSRIGKSTSADAAIYEARAISVKLAAMIAARSHAPKRYFVEPDQGDLGRPAALGKNYFAESSSRAGMTNIRPFCPISEFQSSRARRGVIAKPWLAVIASEAKQSILLCVAAWIASLRSQ
jgi:hypothetical protein